MKKNNQLNIIVITIGIVALITIIPISGFSQKDAANNISAKFIEYSKNMPIEKVYVHTDKNFYVPGEVLWFKIYQFDGVMQRAFNFSKNCFIELIDAQKKPVWQSLIDFNENSGSGSYMLPSTINTGNYILRCYTNWMQNFSEDFYFEKVITIVNPQKPTNWSFNNTTENTISFFPEGGNLVAGLTSKIGFKAIDKNGKGIDAKGLIIKDGTDTIVKFETLNFGMGQFYLTPQSNRKYKASINFEDGTSKLFILPELNKSGIVATITNINKDQVKITVTNSNKQSNDIVYAFVYSGHKVHEIQQKNFNGGKAEFQFQINKLGKGLNQFTIFNHLQQPVWERLYFVHPDAELTIHTKFVQKEFNRREEVVLDVETFAGTLPTAANLSMSVFSSEFQNEETENIYTYLWLSSELKGVIESPQFYFSSEKDAPLALENLLLTQGWRRYNWQNVLQGEKLYFEFLPEYEAPIVTAKTVDKITGLPAANKEAYLSIPGEYFRYSHNKSNQEGILNFVPQKYFGSADIVIQAADNDIRIDLINPFSKKSAKTPLPAFEFNEDQKEQLIKYNIGTQTLNYFQKNNLDKFLSPLDFDTTAFYGKPDNTYLLDNYTRFTTLEEVMREFIPEVRVRKFGERFRFHVLNIPYKNYFDAGPLVLLDGVPIKNIDALMNYDPFRIKKIDIVARKYFNHSAVYNGIVSYTTYDGNLQGFELNADAIVINHNMLQIQREFYSPVYESKDQKENRLPDQRNVLMWKPEIRISENGKTQLKFFTSDVPGKYSIIINGVIKNGVVGSSRMNFNVR
jgi:hypothetical protein